MLFAYWMGAEKIFVENIYADFINKPTGLLANPKLIFLTGVSVSDATLRAICDCVQKGATCISLRSLAPEDVSSRGDLVPEGLGRWVLTNDFKDQQAAEAAAPYLGKKTEIRYRFGQYLLRIDQGKSENEIQITIDQELPEKKIESKRVW